MKTTIAKFLVHLLSFLVPVEDAISHVVAKAARSAIVKAAERDLQLARKEADAAILAATRAATRAANRTQAAARADYEARLTAAQKVAPVITANGAAALVDSAANTPAPTLAA